MENATLPQVGWPPLDDIGGGRPVALAGGATVIMVESVSLLRVLHAILGLRGLSIPGDVSVVLLVDDPGNEVGTGQRASMHIPRNIMGRRAVRLLTSLLTAARCDQPCGQA